MIRKLLGLSLFVLLAGSAVFLVMHGRGNQSGLQSGAAPRFTSSADCSRCHRELYEEWKQSDHAFAFINPLVRRRDMADGFRKKDCIPCHAPRPVFEQGLGKAARVLARDVHRVDGVDCLACHLIPGGVAASRAGLSAPCNPIYRPELTSTNLCAPCHNQHNTVDEWEKSPQPLRGKNCNTCHLPPIARQMQGGGTMAGRFHGARGGRDVVLLKSAARLDCRFPAANGTNELVVTITNVGAAHNLPTDSRHRALDLVVHLKSKEGGDIGPLVDLGPGQKGGYARVRFRNPYRAEFGMVNTQIPAGESRVLQIPIDPETIHSAEILLLYKRTPFVPDKEATIVERRSIVF